MFGLGPLEILGILLVALLVFGKRLPEIGRGVGKSIVEFKKGLAGIEDELHTDKPVHYQQPSAHQQQYTQPSQLENQQARQSSTMNQPSAQAAQPNRTSPSASPQQNEPPQD